MKKLIITLFITVLFSINSSAQIPEGIKSELISLTSKVDKLDDVKSIKKEITGFTSNAPSDKMKMVALNFIKNKSTSSKVKEVIDSLITVPKEKISNEYIVLKNATIIDAVSNVGKKGDILIKADKIEIINFSNTLKTPEGASIYDLTGKFIIPGLIDSHVHITHGTLKEAQQNLEVALKRGVTGVRDMGGDGRMLTLLKKNMQIGEDIGPDVFFSTIIAGPGFFENDPRPQQVAKGAVAGDASWQKAVTIDSDFKQVIAEAKGLGATAIKVYTQVNKNVFDKVAAEAKRQGLKVWAHAVVPPTKALDITNGGADVMSHAGDMVQYEFIKGDLKGRHQFESKEAAASYRNNLKSIKWNENSPEVKKLFNAMKTNNSILDATLFVYTFGLDKPKNDKKIDSSRYKNGIKAVRIAHKMGVKVGAGSDHMISEDNTINIHKELELLTFAGLSNIDAIKAATIVNAEGLGEEKNVGTIEPGKLANLIILNADPLVNIKNTRAIKFVIKRGKVINSDTGIAQD